MVDQRHKTTVEIAVDDRAVRQLGNSIRTALSSDQVDRLNRALDESIRRMRQLGGAAAPPRLPPVQVPGRPMPGGAGGGLPGGQPPPWVQQLANIIQGQRQPMGPVGTAAATGAGVLGAGWLQRAGGAAGGLARGEGATERAWGAIPVVGPVFAGAIGAMRQLAGEYVSFRQQVAGSAGTTGTNRMPNLARFGIDPTEMPGRLAGLGEASMLRGRDLGRFAQSAIGLERTIGLQAGRSGALVGAAGIGTAGQTGKEAEKLLVRGVETGVAAGFRIGKFGDLLGDIASHVAGLRERGIMVSPEATMRLVATLGATQRKGLMGEPALYAAKTMEGMLRGAPDRSDFGSALAMKLAMKRGGGDVFEAQKILEGSSALASTSDIVLDFIKEVAKMGGSIGGQVNALRQAFGTQIGFGQGEQLLKAAQAGELSDEMTRQVLAGREAEIVAAGQAGREPGAAATAAGLTAQRLGAGAEHVKALQQLQIAELQLAKVGAGLGDVLASTTTQLVGWGREGLKLFQEGLPDALKVIGKAAKEFASILEDAGATIFDGITALRTGTWPTAPNQPPKLPPGIRQYPSVLRGQ